MLSHGLSRYKHVPQDFLPLEQGEMSRDLLPLLGDYRIPNTLKEPIHTAPELNPDEMIYDETGEDPVTGATINTVDLMDLLRQYYG